jgi:DNA-binding NtrC family response regulator
MTTASHPFRSPVIQSVTVSSITAPTIFVVTKDLSLINVVRNLLSDADEEVSIVWLTSVASACLRLAGGEPAMVIVDGTEAAEGEAMDILHATAPEARVLVLTGETNFPGLV